MRIYMVLLIVGTLLIGCSSKANDLPNSYEEADNPSRQMFKQHRGTPEFRAYASALTDFMNRPEKMDSREDCSKFYHRGEEMVHQIMVIDGDGKVVRVFHNAANEVADCEVRNQLGKVYPKPPFSPFYVRGLIASL